MPKLTFDVSDVDLANVQTFAPYEGDVPRPGTYNAEIVSVRLATSQNNNTYFKVLYRLGHDQDPKKDKVATCPIFDNVVPGQHQVQQERLAFFFKAICGKQKAVVDAEDIDDGGKVSKIGGKDPAGVKVRVIVQRETYQGEPQARIAGVLPWPKASKWLTEGPASDLSIGEPEEEPDAEPEAFEEEVDVEPDGEEEETDEADAEPDGEEDPAAERQADLEAMNRTDLKKVLKEVNAAFRVLKTTTDAELIEAILDSEFEAEPEGEADEEESEGDEPEDDDDPTAARVAQLASMDRTALKAALKTANPAFRVLKSTTDDQLREEIVTAEFPDAAEPEGDEPPF